METTNQATRALYSAYRFSKVRGTDLHIQAESICQGDGNVSELFYSYLKDTNQTKFGDHNIMQENVNSFIYWLEDELM